MSAIATIPNPPPAPLKLPTHLDLPDTDGKPVDNTYQPMQWEILRQSIEPQMQRLHPDGQFLVAVDHGIYFQNTHPPLNGCRAPDLMIVEGVPPVLPDYPYRRSYVKWQELVSPTLLTELVSSDGSEEHDRTPGTGKFWIYERVVCTAFYCIYDPITEILEVFELSGGRFRPVRPNERGHFPIPPLEVEIGLQRATFAGLTFAWVRFFDNEGRLLPTQGERANDEAKRADDEAKRADDEAKRADDEAKRADDEAKRADDEAKRAEQLEKDKQKLLKKLLELGIDPNGS
jgi:Uma2 family endonuclease